MASLIHTNLKQSYLEQPRDRLFAFQKHQEQARRPPPPTMDPRSPPAPAAGLRVYEDVEPPYRWESGKDADVLVVDLTGFKGEDAFKKEHLKVRIDNYGNLKVSGERPLAGGRGDRWRRFQRVHRMADDCNPSEIKAKFDSGSLSVVMPKLIKTQPPAPAPSAAPPVKPEEKAAAAGAEVAASASRKAGEPGEARTDTRQERAKPEAGNGRKGAEKPDQPWSPRPLAKREEPKQGKAGLGGLEEKEKRRRSRWVVVAVAAAAAMVVVLVGLGIYLRRRRMMSGPDEAPESFTDLY
uniref:17. class I heat shock protein n=1 Tax=Anthurium amnicola TaxID=1678845 RepID=A0A1D1YA20_9ARAE